MSKIMGFLDYFNKNKKYFLINYKITFGKFDNGKWIDTKESKIYQYIISAEDVKSAEGEFSSEWHDDACGIKPNPYLSIISVDDITEEFKRGEIKKGKNEIRFF